MPMPRRSRLRLANVPLHIIQRGNNRGACFFADEEPELGTDHGLSSLQLPAR
jgi:putative transposase